MKVVYVSDDGLTFGTQKACEAYESSNRPKCAERTFQRLVEENCNQTFCDDAGFRIIEPHNVVEFVREHRTEVLEFLKTFE